MLCEDSTISNTVNILEACQISPFFITTQYFVNQLHRYRTLDVSLKLSILAWNHMAAILRGSNFKLAVNGTYGKKGLCCHYNACIFITLHQYCFLSKAMSESQLCMSKMNQKNKVSGRSFIITAQRKKNHAFNPENNICNYIFSICLNLMCKN